jgi:sugar lactone lactonase YvrE
MFVLWLGSAGPMVSGLPIRKQIQDGKLTRNKTCLKQRRPRALSIGPDFVRVLGRGGVMSEPKVLLSGLGIPESPRWHEGRLWFCNWIDRQVVAVSLDGQPEVMLTRDPDSYPMGYSIDWLPDGRLLVTGDQLRCQEPDGSLAVHAGQGANEIMVDGRGNIYLNGADFDFGAGAPPTPGYIKLVTPDGQLRQVAGDIQFPNGMVITPDDRTLIISESFAGRLTAFDIDPDGGLSGRRAFAEGLGPDGITMDAEGAVWAGSGGFGVARVAEGGEVLQRVELPESRAPFAVMLGGPDRRTLFILTAEWRPADGPVANLDRLASGPRTGEILTLRVPVPGVGRP